MAKRPTLTTSTGTPLGGRTEMPIATGGISVADSKLAREIAELVREQNRGCCFTIPAASSTGAR